MANSFTLTGIAKTVNELGTGLMSSMIKESDLLSTVSIMEGIKYKAKLNYISNTPVFQARSCYPTPLTVSTLSQREITVCDLMDVEDICLSGEAGLESVWAGAYMAGSYNETLPTEILNVFLAEKSVKLINEISKVFIQGDTTLSGNLAKCDGLIKLYKNDTAVIDYGATTGTKVNLTSANAISTINAMIALVSEEILEAEDLTIYMSFVNYRTLVNAYFALDNNFYDATALKSGEFVLPTEMITVKRLKEMSGVQEIFITPASNMVFGTDLKSDYNNMKMFFDPNDEVLKFRAYWKQGAQVYFPSYVVLYSGVPV